jgi:hypothetical protein
MKQLLKMTKYCLCSRSDYLLDGLRSCFLSKNQTTRQRRPTSDHQVLYSVGGMSRREASKSGEKFDPKEGKWTPICK